MGRQLLTLIGLAAIVAGCGSAQPATRPPADQASENRTLAAARERLVRRCMAERSFTMSPAQPGFRRALLGSPRQTGTLRLAGGAIVTYRSHGCHADAMAALYGSVRRYHRYIWRRNELRMATASRGLSSAERRLATALTHERAVVVERARRIVG